MMWSCGECIRDRLQKTRGDDGQGTEAPTRTGREPGGLNDQINRDLEALTMVLAALYPQG